MLRFAFGVSVGITLANWDVTSRLITTVVRMVIPRIMTDTPEPVS